MALGTLRWSVAIEPSRATLVALLASCTMRWYTTRGVGLLVVQKQRIPLSISGPDIPWTVWPLARTCLHLSLAGVVMVAKGSPRQFATHANVGDGLITEYEEGLRCEAEEAAVCTVQRRRQSWRRRTRRTMPRWHMADAADSGADDGADDGADADANNGADGVRDAQETGDGAGELADTTLVVAVATDLRFPSIIFILWAVVNVCTPWAGTSIRSNSSMVLARPPFAAKNHRHTPLVFLFGASGTYTTE